MGLPTDGWPRRLLYIAGHGMKSLEWKEGNWYGDAKEPEYSVLSYTWGKYEHMYHMHPVLKIDGIPWTAPCICPLHFSADEFTEVITRLKEEHKVKYLWLDVACIDQRKESPEKISEIGRQFGIFKRAAKTFVWLTTIREDKKDIPPYGEVSRAPLDKDWIEAQLDRLDDP